MRGLLRSAVLVALPHGGQRGSRSNAATALRDVRRDCAEQAAAARALDAAAWRGPERRAVSR